MMVAVSCLEVVYAVFMQVVQMVEKYLLIALVQMQSLKLNSST